MAIGISPAGPCQSGDWAIDIDLDAITFGIRQVDRLADDVIGGSLNRHANCVRMSKPAGQIGARGHQESGVEEARLPPVVTVPARDPRASSRSGASSVPRVMRSPWPQFSEAENRSEER